MLVSAFCHVSEASTFTLSHGLPELGNQPKSAYTAVDRHRFPNKLVFHKVHQVPDYHLSKPCNT